MGGPALMAAAGLGAEDSMEVAKGGPAIKDEEREGESGTVEVWWKEKGVSRKGRPTIEEGELEGESGAAEVWWRREDTKEEKGRERRVTMGGPYVEDSVPGENRAAARQGEEKGMTREQRKEIQRRLHRWNMEEQGVEPEGSARKKS